MNAPVQLAGQTGTWSRRRAKSRGVGRAIAAESDLPLQVIAADVEAGRYKAKPTRVFRFEDIREAHRVMESNEAKGKMVVVL